jgi:hypothetical protein
LSQPTKNWGIWQRKPIVSKANDVEFAVAVKVGNFHVMRPHLCNSMSLPRSVRGLVRRPGIFIPNDSIHVDVLVAVVIDVSGLPFNGLITAFSYYFAPTLEYYIDMFPDSIRAKSRSAETFWLHNVTV